MDSIKYITIKGTTYQLEGGEGGSPNITAVKVGDTSYTPDGGGVISLPAYPTGGDAGYSVLDATEGGRDVSLVTTGEKYIWNNKQDAIEGLDDIRSGAAAGSTALQPGDVQEVTVNNGTSPLAWNTDVTIGTVNGVALTAKLPEKPTYTGGNARSISSIALTSGNGAPGTTDTYKISYTDNSTPTTFTVYNGADGHTPTVSVTKNNGVTTINIDGHTATINDGTNAIDGTTPTVSKTISTDSNGRNTTTVAFSYGAGDSRNTSFSVKDGKDGVVDYSAVEGYISASEYIQALKDRIEVLESYHQIVSEPTINYTTPFETSTTVYINVPSDTTVRYTTDGSEPTSSSDVYSGSFTISSSTTVKAKAFKSNSFSLTVTKEIVKSPTISGNTSFDDTTVVTITADSDEIRYTTDGSTPNSSSNRYTSSIELDKSTTIKAIAYRNGVASSVTTKTFSKNQTIVITVSAPTINGYTGTNNNVTFDNSITPTIITTENGAVTYYTIDETTPTTSSLTGTPNAITSTTIVKARSYKNDTWSEMTVVTFTKTEPTPSSNIYYVGTDVNEANDYQSNLNYDDSNFPTSLTLSDKTLYFAIPTNKEVTVEDSTSHGTFTQRIISTENGYKIIKVPANNRTITGTVNITLN